MGARVHNHTAVTGLARAPSGEGWRLLLAPAPTDPKEADAPRNTGGATVNASVVLNLAGAWVDNITRRADTAPKCTGIKGIHIAVNLPPAFRDWGVFTYNSLGEPLYCLPMGGFHYIGLTRTPFAGDATGISADDAEIGWLLDEANRCFPNLAIGRRDVLFTWAGVNPLTFDPDQPLGSRDIVIHDLQEDGLPDVFTLTGGPVMTHRRVANRLLKVVKERLKPSAPPQSLTFEPSYLDAERNAPRVTDGASSIAIDAVVRAARDEMASSLTDIMTRRLGLCWTADQGRGLTPHIAETAAPHLGWSTDRTAREVDAYLKHLEAQYRRPG